MFFSNMFFVLFAFINFQIDIYPEGKLGFEFLFLREKSEARRTEAAGVVIVLEEVISDACGGTGAKTYCCLISFNSATAAGLQC